MSDRNSHYSCQIQNVRERAQLSQATLAKRAGLTRQAVSLLEQGRIMPAVTTALALAEVLGCTVSDLYLKKSTRKTLEVVLADGPSQSGKRVRMAAVRDKWIGIPAVAHSSNGTEGFAEADGLLTGTEKGTTHVQPMIPLDHLRHNLVLAGCDPALGILSGFWNRHGGEGNVLWLNRPTTASLEALVAGEAHVAGVHLPDAETEHSLLAALPMAVEIVRFAQWEQGWMVQRGNPVDFQGVEHLVSERIRLLNRPPGSGSRILLDRMLDQAGIEAKAVPSYQSEGSTHFSCAHAIHAGQADVALGLLSVAESSGLDFLPIQQVAFDLVIPRDLLECSPVRRMLDLLHHRGFRHQLDGLPGYETRETGSVQSAQA